MNDLKKWFFSQTKSTRTLILAALALIVVLSIFEFIVNPWKQNLNSMRVQVEDKVDIVAWLEQKVKSNKALIQTVKKQGDKATASSNNSSLITKIEQSAKNMKIYSSIERISPDKVGRVKVWINKGDFALLLKWIESLKPQSIDVFDARVSKIEDDSPVAIIVTFKSS